MSLMRSHRCRPTTKYCVDICNQACVCNRVEHKAMQLSILPVLESLSADVIGNMSLDAQQNNVTNLCCLRCAISSMLDGSVS
eukprot:1689857-Amphidinium_carterae.1